ncbi:N-acetylmuramoyl-L-alanine amidase LytC precursor [Clostridium chromiireducens]|uniref:N-acetylmuramoyl-L-alanine amidase LytC n=2 Tax=Clostridium chromiireducens TaxID=225345 RepID=A0A1V4IUR3_9CLOT|nr:N-acetylmuramoyl-L-alanine amidase LytC precursor [Clostridium chromiireducens]
MGHPFNCGAFGIMSETDGNRAVGKLLIEKLKTLGHTVVNCTYDTNVNELSNRVALANAQTLDLFISLHMDSFTNPGANGVTVYTTANSSAKAIASNIVNKVADSCNYYNRGWKEASFYVLRSTNAPALLLEMGFVTNQGDCDKFNAEKISNAIVEAITGETISSLETIQEYGYVVTQYLPNGYHGNNSFNGVDADYVLGYFNDVKCYFRGNEKGVWIETQTLPIEKCNKLKNILGSWFYSIEK